MDKSFSRWRDSPLASKKSFVISDSDEEIDANVGIEKIYVAESSESSTAASRSTTPEKWQLNKKPSINEIERRVKKYIPHYSDDDEDSNNEVYNLESSNNKDGNYMDYSNTSDDSDDVVVRSKKTKKKNRFHDSTIESMNKIVLDDKSSDSSILEEHGAASTSIQSRKNERFKEERKDQQDMYSTNGEDSSEPEIVMITEEKEIDVDNTDSQLVEKEVLLCKMDHLKNELSKTQLLLKAGNIDLLPDKGEKLRERIALQQEEIEKIAAKLENTSLAQSIKTELYSYKQDTLFTKKELDTKDELYSIQLDSDCDVHYIPPSLEQKELGTKAQATLNKELALTVDRLQDLHGSLLARPSEEERASDPQGLKVKLMPHQQHALAWLMWREQQRPPGGILADDMGLGKTLTMISLIIAAKKAKVVAESSDDEWLDQKTTLRHKGGTLVVCPASLLSQWENEIRNRCRRSLLSIEVYHGTNREHVPKKLARNDVVITTYNILNREFKSMSTSYKIHWERVILDEAHVIRNHKSQASEAICGLVANKRWALTGTPIQNKELDLYSILKFLKCTPFDDLRVWKRWVDNKNAAGRQRLTTVMNTLMLRRTKQELQDKGELESLPDKTVEEVSVTLDSQEQLVYEKVLIYSRTLFAQFLSQRAEKDHMRDLATGIYDQPTFLSNPNKNTRFTKAQNKLLSLHADVKAYEILGLLLRLRQVCVHPSLIHSMLDQEDMMASGIMDTANMDPNILSEINNISLQESNDVDDKEIGVDRRVATTDLLTSKNPVFKVDRVSSKMKAVVCKVEEILKNNDKLIIVSQWTSTLNIMAKYLSSMKGATFCMFTGSVAIKDRQGVMDSFNFPDRDPKILLLSLTAGGVGLNLVGANHLLLMDIHWNPQLEVQAQDRIYRFGQNKDVFIYKFICKDTIEERIKLLQEKKISIAQNVLSGDKSSVASKLSFDDMKSLFAL
ncbi:transcription termination factor 2 isoform X2 [Colletes gigas]|uniref:transcription termination factor 2 isoform X2 n=1 Tax=Colletes gigas TaxID=935657 RepID=UPI001C9AA785|nr:transcription termination factor 2 isoform X2 [Colletes gigas]